MHHKLSVAIIILSLQGFGFASSDSKAKGSEPGKDIDVSQPIRGGYALKVDVDSVQLNVSVRDRDTNRSISGLRKLDFSVYEDGIQQQIDEFQPTDSPFSLLLLLDVSGSTGSYLKLMKEAAVQFVDEINANDRVAIAVFNSKVRLIQEFTSDRDAAEHAIQHIKSGGGTAFYDALSTCIDRYTDGIQGRTAIVVFTDGIDSQLEGMPESGSHISFDELDTKVQESKPIVYTIFLDTQERFSSIAGTHSRSGSPGWAQRGFPFPLPFLFPRIGAGSSPRQVDDEDSTYRQAREQLKVIAEQTGGRMYSPHKVEELSGAYSDVANDLRTQYQLGYNSTNRTHDGKWRNIRVQLDRNPAAIVRTRKGYYAANKIN